jgi:lipopolysaccharide transport system ATP-binding protein
MGLIQVSKLSKEYLGFSKPSKRILAGLTFGYLGIDARYMALNDISFGAEPGEAIGIIGRNGAGKSTLLKLLAGVITAETGVISINGTVRALLELSVGFNSELSGEENIYYNGLVWGYKPSEIASLMNQIFEFAGLEEFRHAPLKNYSSGMAMRLGFSLATAKRPDILIVDEALAVGDASFQQKCLKRFDQFLQAGSVVLFVSHDLGLVTHFCKRILLLDKGKLLFDGSPKLGIEKYMQLLASDEPSMISDTNIRSLGNYLSQLQIALVKDGVVIPNITFVNDSVTLEIKFTAKLAMESLTVGFHIDDEKGIRIFGTNSKLLGHKSLSIGVLQSVRVSFHFPVFFREGKYSIGVALHKGESHTEGSYLWSESVYNFEVERVNLPRSVGVVYLPVSVESQISG